MTENKRFTAIGENVWQDGEVWCVAGGKHCAEVIATALNDLVEENEQYKSRIELLERKIQRERNATQKQYGKWENEALEKIKNLEKENAKLSIEVEALKQIKPLRKLPRELNLYIVRSYGGKME